MESVLAWIVQEQIPLRKIEKSGLTLEALFMKVVGK